MPPPRLLTLFGLLIVFPLPLGVRVPLRWLFPFQYFLHDESKGYGAVKSYAQIRLQALAE